jgi:hypothetical protein
LHKIGLLHKKRDGCTKALRFRYPTWDPIPRDMMICKECLQPVGKFDSQVIGMAAKGGRYCIHEDCLIVIDGSPSNRDRLLLRLPSHGSSLTRS